MHVRVLSPVPEQEHAWTHIVDNVRSLEDDGVDVVMKRQFVFILGPHIEAWYASGVPEQLYDDDGVAVPGTGMDIRERIDV